MVSIQRLFHISRARTDRQGATFAHAVIREILLDAVEASKIWARMPRIAKQWKDALKHIAPYQIGRYGQLMEWSKDIDDPKDEHRHVNHLFGLHPGRTISPITTPVLAKASKVVLETSWRWCYGMVYGLEVEPVGLVCTMAIMPTSFMAIC